MIELDEEDPVTAGKTPIDKSATLELGQVHAATVLFTMGDHLIDHLIQADVFRE